MTFGDILDLFFAQVNIILLKLIVIFLVVPRTLEVQKAIRIAS